MFQAATVRLQEPFSRQSGERLAHALIHRLGTSPKACWLFCSCDPALEDFVGSIYLALGAPQFIGCTTDGEISTAGFSTKSAVLAGVVSDQVDFQVVAVPQLSHDPEQAGRALAQEFTRYTRYLQIFSDGITGNGCAILRGIRARLPANVPISGGTSGDNGRFVQTWQFSQGQILTDALVAIGFMGDFNVGTGVQSGWAPIGLPKKVTRAAGNVLYELNGEPALKVLKRFLGKHAEKLPAVGVEYPLGFFCKSEVPDDCRQNGKDGQFLLRATMKVNIADGSIHFAGEIPQGAMVYLTCGDSASILEATVEATRQALHQLSGFSPVMAFVYSCMARKIVLGKRVKDEFESIFQQFSPSPVPIIGYYSYGEYSPGKADGPCFLHNETAAISVIGV